MTSQPQLSTTPAEAPEAALRATPVSPAEAVSTASDLLQSPVTTPPSAAPRGWWQRFGSPSPKPLLLGFLGSLLLAFGGLGAGGVLVHDPILEGTPLAAWRFGHGYDLAVMVVYLGLALEVWAWMLLGRDVLARRANARAVLTTSALWLLPMLVTPPLFTRDVYSYLAQGTMPLRGFDPYGGGPDVLSGPVLDNVHWFWQDTPAPYGPLFILIAKGIAAVTGENIIAGVLLMRLAMVVGLALFVAALPGLTRHLGGRLPVTLWVAVANPVMVIHLVGGPHNDLLLLGLLSMGSLLVLNRKHAAGIGMVTLAMAVKASAGVALPFLVLVWAARLTGPQRTRIIKATAAGVGVFLPVFAACTLVAKVGLGWLPALNAPAMIVNWLSLSTGTGELLFNIVSWAIGGLPKTPFFTVTRIIGGVALLVIGVRQWLAARGGGPDAVRRAGIVLLLVALLSPATLPWYYTWGMALLAGTAWTARRMQVVIFVSCFLVIAAFPDGEVSLYAFGYLLLAMAGALVASIALVKPDPLRLRSRPVRLPAADG
ncbi:MAG TPA: polyprenol phosphomannose-dependent alpha 1,6 mannosyltransferase MptB [Pseudonocardia sp.]|jgi:alpha-1,6-mannosyltransferase|nr:polyprenol phosphomannose-dependent alpha 1,6 mannosyltransferase MptB [Pseudonocardia sp.]